MIYKKAIMRGLLLLFSFLLIGVASADVSIVNDTLFNLDNNAFIKVLAPQNSTNITLYDSTDTPASTLQFYINGTPIRFTANTNKTLSNISYNNVTDVVAYTGNGTTGYLNVSARMSSSLTFYNFKVDGSINQTLQSNNSGWVTFNYTGWSQNQHNFNITIVYPAVPPSPTGLSSTQGNFWINYTWSAGTGNVTNSYNVNVNGTWTNGSSNTYNNNSGLAPHGWSNISVYSYNNSGTGTLNTTSLSGTAQVSNNPVTMGNILTSYTLTEGNTLSIYPTSNDPDSDTVVFARNFIDGAFTTNNGTLLWTTTESDIGIYYWQINVSDGYGSVSPANFTVTVNPVPPPPPPGPLYSSHRLYKNETTPQLFCSKCHTASGTNVSSGVHNPINCLCHGYNPNQTAQYNVNVKHNLTRNIYCTNCHTKYNETSGDITIKPGVSGKNQSAHYIIRNKTDPQLYNNSRGFFSR